MIDGAAVPGLFTDGRDWMFPKPCACAISDSASHLIGRYKCRSRTGLFHMLSRDRSVDRLVSYKGRMVFAVWLLISFRVPMSVVLVAT